MYSIASCFIANNDFCTFRRGKICLINGTFVLLEENNGGNSTETAEGDGSETTGNSTVNTGGEAGKATDPQQAGTSGQPATQG